MKLEVYNGIPVAGDPTFFVDVDPRSVTCLEQRGYPYFVTTYVYGPGWSWWSPLSKDRLLVLIAEHGGTQLLRIEETVGQIAERLADAERESEPK